MSQIYSIIFATKIKIMKNICIAFAFVLFSACSSEGEAKDYTAENDLEIQAYIADNNLTAQKSSSGLYYIINNLGTGTQPTTRDNVTVAYKGYFTNKTIFDQSDSNGISFGLQQVIAGWTEGITYFKEGGSGILLIPSAMGYGNKGRGNIPGGAVLIFNVDLISVN